MKARITREQLLRPLGSNITQLIAEDRNAAEFFSRVGIVHFMGDKSIDWREAVRNHDEADLMFLRDGLGMNYEEAIRHLEAHWAEKAPEIAETQEKARAEIARAEERRRAEEAEDREIAEWDAEICAHPIGHPGHTPHGCT
jgi:hypothetical protein